MQYAMVPQTQNTVRLAVSFLRIGVLWLWVSKEEKDTLRNGDSGWLYVVLLLLDDSVRRPCHSRLCYTLSALHLSVVRCDRHCLSCLLLERTAMPQSRKGKSTSSTVSASLLLAWTERSVMTMTMTENQKKVKRHHGRLPKKI
jgi:hypothetical protein